MKYGGGPPEFGSTVRDLDFQDRLTAIRTMDARSGLLKLT